MFLFRFESNGWGRKRKEKKMRQKKSRYLLYHQYKTQYIMLSKRMTIERRIYKKTIEKGKEKKRKEK